LDISLKFWQMRTLGGDRLQLVKFLIQTAYLQFGKVNWKCNKSARLHSIDLI
jgi:hypothetical protein